MPLSLDVKVYRHGWLHGASDGTGDRKFHVDNCKGLSETVDARTVYLVPSLNKTAQCFD
jgi:hypothetical protein